MRNEVFYFRRFAVRQSGAAMKVGADSMLLGAMTDAGTAKRILDIGTGSGVLALMMAQKSQAEIDAIDIDASAAAQAAENAGQSIWKHRIHVYHTELQHFEPEHKNPYDLIISNPPFFRSHTVHNKENSRRLARSFSTLSFDILIKHTARLISKPGGMFWAIIPATERDAFVSLCVLNGLFPVRYINIYSYAGGEKIRCILSFCAGIQSPVQEDDFIIYNPGRTYTAAYVMLTRAYHAHDLSGRHGVS